MSFESIFQGDSESDIWIAQYGIDHITMVIQSHIMMYTVAQKTVPMFGHFVMFGL